MILSLLPQKQLLGNWCWAAVTSSVSFYYFNNIKGWRQGDLADRLLGSTCNINQQNAALAPDPCNIPMDIERPLSLSGNFAGEITRPLSFSEIISQINGRHPICCQFFWPGRDVAHFVILYGYEADQVIVGDPDPDFGGFFTLGYDEFISSYRGGGEWKRTIGTRPPRA